MDASQRLQPANSPQQVLSDGISVNVHAADLTSPAPLSSCPPPFPAPSSSFSLSYYPVHLPSPLTSSCQLPSCLLLPCPPALSPPACPALSSLSASALSSSSSSPLLLLPSSVY